MKEDYRGRAILDEGTSGFLGKELLVEWRIGQGTAARCSVLYGTVR